MYITELDELFDKTIDKFYNFLNNKKSFEIFRKETNFVTIQNYIIDLIKEFITKNITEDSILKIVKNKSNVNFIFETIKRYCAYYIYLSIAYLYESGRDLYTTNVIESSKNQKDSTYQIDNFFNSENNSKLISFFYIIKNLLSVIKLGNTMEKIKVILRNNPINFQSTLKFVDELGDDYIIQYVLIKNNFHNIIKTIIFRLIYLNEEKNDILSILKQEEEENAEYKYIEIVTSKRTKLVDFTTIQRFLTIKEIRDGLAEEIYDYLEEFRQEKELDYKENEQYVQYLFTNQVIIPVTDEFLRFHKDSEKYDPESLVTSTSDIKERDATKIKYIINKVSKVRNFKSEVIKNNPKLKLETESFFYKPLDYREAVLYNDNEEIKIVQKLEDSEKTSDLDLLGDLENIRKYSYLNYKDYEGFKIRPSKPTTCIRYINIKYKNSRDTKIETRIGNEDIDINVKGVIWNPSRLSIDCFKKENLVDVKSLYQTKNGFSSFKKIIERTFKSKEKLLFYWIFDPENDIPELDEYVNLNKQNYKSNVFNLLANIFKIYYSNVQKKLLDYVKSFNSLSIYHLNNILNKYSRKYVSKSFDKKMFIDANKYSLLNKLTEKEVIPDKVDSLIPGKQGTIIKLPKIDVEKYQENVLIVTDKKEEVINIDKEQITPICLHYIKWNHLKRIRKKTDEYTQEMFNFIKQYVSLDKNNEYTCKSCGEYLHIPNNVWTGTYVEEKDQFLTTSIVVHEDLEKNPKYAKYKKVIKNLQKNLEKFAYSTNLTFYIGNQETKKVRRKMIIKDTIDLLLLNNKFLKTQDRNRIAEYSKKYGIHQDYTRLFFFELKDDIFVTSSDDTDQFKIIKYNNILSYMIILLICDLNAGQIIGLKYDKICNYYRFNILKEQIFGKLFLRLNQKDKIPALKLPLFCYIIYYFSCILISNYFWLSDIGGDSSKKQKTFNYNLHITVIHTFFDLLNSIIEGNLFYENKNFLYQIISIRIIDKLEHLYSDKELLDRIEEDTKQRFRTDDGKIIKQVINVIPFIDKDTKVIKDKKNRFCEPVTKKLKIGKNKSYNSDLDPTTNCPDGKYHKWKLTDGQLVCSLCNSVYDKMEKQVTSTAEDYQHIINQLKYDYYKKMLKEYCISGQLHEFSDGKEVCDKCKINPFTYKYTDKEIDRFEKNITQNESEKQIKMIDQTKKQVDKLENEKKKSSKIINKFNDRYAKNTNFKINNYIDDFIDKIIKNLGKNVKIDDKEIQIKDTYYFIDHDYLGTEKKNGFKIFEYEKKIILDKNNKDFEKDIYYYKDRTKNITVYYDAATLQYLGYMENNKIFKSKSNSYLKIFYSVRDKLKLLGLSNHYYRKENLTKKDNTNNLIESLLETRVLNLKYIIRRVNGIIYSIKNKYRADSIYSIKEKTLINDFIKSLKKFNVTNQDNQKSVFKHSKYIVNKIPVSKISDDLKVDLNKKYINVEFLDNLNNLDSKLLFFLVYNFNRLLDYNEGNTKVILSTLIINIIDIMFTHYWTNTEDFSIRKFQEILIIDSECPNLRDNNRVVSSYEDLLESNIPIDELKEMEYDVQQEADALDYDDYDDEDEPYMPESEFD